MTRDEWIAEFCRRAGVKRPSVDEIRELLDLAASAAHTSERPAAPLACWVAGRSTKPLPELLDLAAQLAAAAGDGP